MSQFLIILKLKKIKKLNRGKVNIGPAKGMLTPRKLNAFRELKLRTPGKNYYSKTPSYK